MNSTVGRLEASRARMVASLLVGSRTLRPLEFAIERGSMLKESFASVDLDCGRLTEHFPVPGLSIRGRVVGERLPTAELGRPGPVIELALRADLGGEPGRCGVRPPGDATG